MSSSSLLLQINEDYLTCQICMETYQTPKVLACLHSFCKCCLESCEKSAHESYILCPLCRQSTTLGMKGVEGLKNNFVLSNMVAMMLEWRTVRTRENLNEDTEMCQTCPNNESIIATYQCVDCLDKLCADCATFHSRTKLTKDHEVVSLEDIKNGKYSKKIREREMNKCGKHVNQKYEQYCSECDVATCRDCIVEEHQGHKLVPLKQALEKLKNEVQFMQKEIESNIDASKRSLERLMQIENKESENLIEIEQKIEKIAEDFIEAIKLRKSILLEKVQKMRNEKIENISLVKERLEAQIKCMQNCCQLSTCGVQKGTAIELMMIKKNIEETNNDLKEVSRNKETQDKILQLQDCMKYDPNDITTASEEGMGNVSKEKTKVSIDVISKSFQFDENDDTSPIIPAEPTTSTKNDDPRSSTANICNEVLYVELPAENIKPKPRARPRKSKEEIGLVDIYEDSDEENNASICNALEDKPYVKPRLPRKPLTRKSGVPRNYPTAPVRRKHRMKIQPDTFLQKDANGSLENLSPKSPVFFRAAPPPPAASKKPKTSTSSVGSTARASPKKAPAPLPPTVSFGSSMVKASLQKIFEIQGHNRKDFSNPIQGAAITSNHIFILDADERQVIIFNSEGYYDSRFQVNIPNQGKVKPTSIASRSSTERIYVLYPTSVTVWSQQGSLLSIFGHKHLLGAHGIAIDSQERVVIADEGKHCVTVFSRNGNYITHFGDSQTQFKCPRFVCTTRKDEIIVSDYQTNSVQIFTADGKLRARCTTTESKLRYPRGVATILPSEGQSELILIADQGFNRISVYDMQGKFLYHILESVQDRDLKNIQNISVSKNNKLVVLQTHSIQGQLYNLRRVSPT